MSLLFVVDDDGEKFFYGRGKASYTDLISLLPLLKASLRRLLSYTAPDDKRGIFKDSNLD